MNSWPGILALLAPLLHAGLMGLIGYPLALRRRGGMAAFHRSGFTWWLITMAIILLFGIGADPGLLLPSAPSTGGQPLWALLTLALLGFVVCLALELAATMVATGRELARRSTGRQRYDAALPAWAEALRVESALLALTAILEEAGTAASPSACCWPSACRPGWRSASRLSLSAALTGTTGPGRYC